MKVLYLTGDYLYTKVHNSLIKNLLQQNKELEIYVFSPVRVDNAHGIEDSYYRDIRLKVFTPKIDIPLQLFRYDFFAKQRCKVRLIEQCIPLHDIDFIHAATMFSEGGTAYRLNKKYGIPYFVSIRGADVMTYSLKMPHLWLLGNRILNNSDALVCVTPAIKNKMQYLWQYRYSRQVINKSYIINNGIDSLWINNLNLTPQKINKPIRVIYIGRFDRNKNVLRLVKAIELLRNNYEISLTLVGGKGEEHERVIKKVSNNKSFMEYLGPIYDKEQLMSLVRASDIFAMVSHSETFGLVYAECLSQGLPLVYTNGTGFSDIYPQGVVGYGVNSYSSIEISKGIENVIKHYDVIRGNISTLDFSMFYWPEVAEKYRYIYDLIKRKNNE